jgi:hypothetical protein
VAATEPNRKRAQLFSAWRSNTLAVVSDFDTFECDSCGDDFKALPEANAAQKELCSPACETDQLA